MTGSEPGGAARLVLRLPRGFTGGERALMALCAAAGASGTAAFVDASGKPPPGRGEFPGWLRLNPRPAELRGTSYARLSEKLSGYFAGGRRAAVSAAREGRIPGKVLLFRNLLSKSGGRGTSQLHQSAFFLASSLRAAGAAVVLSDVSLGPGRGAVPSGLMDLERLLKENPDISAAGISILEAYLPAAKRLLSFLSARVDAFIFAGGMFPTSHPWHCLAHLPEADFIVRGAGEEVFPFLLRRLGGSRPSGGMAPAMAAGLCQADGVLGRAGDLFFAGAPGRVNRAGSMDSLPLDMGLLEKADIGHGAVFSLSRGCLNSCSFCTSFDKGHFHSASPARVLELLKMYRERLARLFGGLGAIPESARGVAFYDDDFLSDLPRAASIAGFLSRGDLYLNFIQTGVKSVVSAGKLPRVLGPAAFGRRPGGTTREKTDVYVGTENFSEAELTRLGKGYGYAGIERAVSSLSGARLRQAHHLILTNVFTGPQDVFENLSRLVELRSGSGPYFDILRPAERHLQSFFGTGTYRAVEKAGFLGRLKIAGVLALPGFPEFDFPLVEKDFPENALASAAAAAASGALDAGDFELALEDALVASFHAADPGGPALSPAAVSAVRRMAGGGRA